MKILYSALLVAGLVALVGCNTSPSGGNTGATSKGAVGQTKHPEAFTLKGPTDVLGHTVKHGATENFKVTVSAGEDFKEDVDLSAKVEPDGRGVKAEMEPKTWKASGPNQVNVKVSADDKAPMGPYTVTVTGTPKIGAATSVHFDVKVPEKK
jgi:hypothetical protein